MDERRNPRVVSDKSIHFRRNRITTAVRLYNLSVDGCMVATTENALNARDYIEIEFEEGIGAEGEVVWAGGNIAGIRFFGRLHPVVVQYFGYRLRSNSFNEKRPRDRFGRILRSLPVMIARADTLNVVKRRRQRT
jgi:hypothetical protein